MTGAQLTAEIQLALATGDCRLWRNQVGKYQLADGRWLSSGLAVGSADLIGWKTKMITQEMVGEKIAIFASIEVKGHGDRATDKQRNWSETVRKAGGITAFARSVEEAREALK